MNQYFKLYKREYEERTTLAHDIFTGLLTLAAMLVVMALLLLIML